MVLAVQMDRKTGVEKISTACLHLQSGVKKRRMQTLSYPPTLPSPQSRHVYIVCMYMYQYILVLSLLLYYITVNINLYMTYWQLYNITTGIAQVYYVNIFRHIYIFFTYIICHLYSLHYIDLYSLHRSVLSLCLPPPHHQLFIYTQFNHVVTLSSMWNLFCIKWDRYTRTIN